MLHRGMNELAGTIGVDLAVTGNPPRGGILVKNESGEEDLLLKSIFLQETVKRGILFGGPVFICYSHTSGDIEATLKASGEAMEILKTAIDSGDPASYLEGEPIGVVFRERK